MPLTANFRNNENDFKTFNYVGYVDSNTETITFPFEADKITLENNGKNTLQITSLSPAVNIAPSDTYTLPNITKITIKSLVNQSLFQITGYKQSLSDAEEEKTFLIGGVNVDKYGAKGDGVTDDTDAIQRAFNENGPGKRYIFTGNYKARLGALNFPAFTTIEGQSLFLGTGSSPQTQIKFIEDPSGTTGIECGANVVFKDILLRGPGKGVVATGIHSTSSIQLERVQFYDWYKATDLADSYYSRIVDSEWAYCLTAMTLTGCYNMDLYGPIFRKVDEAMKIPDQVRALNIYGGSIEGFKNAGGIKTGTGSSLINLYGTYFESSVVGDDGFGIQLSNSCVLNTYGCMVYLTELNRWINASGLSNVTINAQGNKFICPNTSVVTPTAYYLPNTGNVNISGDDWSDVQKGNYSSSSSGVKYSATNFNIKAPEQVTSHGLIEYQGRPIVFPQLTAEPSYKTAGMMCLADGVNWDPLTKANGKPYYVAYNGTAWQSFT